MSFFVPKIFTAIAFDSGGVASGPMTATFLLPFARAPLARPWGGNVITDAFGVVGHGGHDAAADHPAAGASVQVQDEARPPRKRLTIPAEEEIIEL